MRANLLNPGPPFRPAHRPRLRAEERPDRRNLACAHHVPATSDHARQRRRRPEVCHADPQVKGWAAPNVNEMRSIPHKQCVALAGNVYRRWVGPTSRIQPCLRSASRPTCGRWTAKSKHGGTTRAVVRVRSRWHRPNCSQPRMRSFCRRMRARSVTDIAPKPSRWDNASPRT
jgi:hypothetical protein